MRNRAVTVFSLLLVLALLLSVSGTAKAAVGDDPTVTPVSGDKEFTTEVISIAQFPGTTEFNQMLVPVGFPAGEAQYEGTGVIVKGMENGKATVCFAISGTQWGWGGKVGSWDGTKWVLLPTTIAATVDETATTYACATITGNGTYAFIKYVVDSTLLPQMQECPFDFAIDVFYIVGSWTPSGSGYTDTITGMEFITTEDISGRPVTVEYLYSVPATDLSDVPVFSWEGPASGIANFDGFVHYRMTVSPNIDYYRSYIAHSEFYRVTIGGCYKITERIFIEL
jgi:hypothetical protein